MKFKYAGKYNGSPESLPQRTQTGAVQFKEFEDLMTFGIIMNAAAIVLWIGLVAAASFRAGSLQLSAIGALLSIATMVPHEFLHALCFREEVKMYHNLKDGMLFVAGTEDMSRAQFVLMSMLPNLVFGFLPFIVFMIFPQIPVIGTLSTLAICMGAGDYYNVFNCLTQVPKGAKVFMSGIHTFWYMPEDK
ncbi:MAG: DUF3267 domain-containing protein [Ruminococcus sp.]|nr:DUF3267 domain-containing protein [Ruminococcus sp.]